MQASVALLTALTLLGVARPAEAVDILRQEVRMAVRDCQGALPSFEGAIRKRPLAVQNEGAQIAFVTCGMEGNNTGVANTSNIFVILRNTGASTQTVGCTLIDGGLDVNTPAFFPKSVAVPVGPDATFISWNTNDNGGNKFLYPAISCALPPGVGISATERTYTEDIGS
ncbi:MAG: hypothetical protein ABJA62_11735 [Luteimonas sp.]